MLRNSKESANSETAKPEKKLILTGTLFHPIKQSLAQYHYEVAEYYLVQAMIMPSEGYKNIDLSKKYQQMFVIEIKALYDEKEIRFANLPAKLEQAKTEFDDAMEKARQLKLNIDKTSDEYHRSNKPDRKFHR